MYTIILNRHVKYIPNNILCVIGIVQKYSLMACKCVRPIMFAVKIITDKVLVY